MYQRALLTLVLKVLRILRRGLPSRCGSEFQSQNILLGRGNVMECPRSENMCFINFSPIYD
jgi:hypothetical protein